MTGNTDGSSSGDSGGGLSNLFALAHLATMTGEEQRCLKSTSSPRTDNNVSPKGQGTMPRSSPPKAAEQAAESTNTNNTRLSPPSRRPAKKRAVPADFDTPIDVLPTRRATTCTDAPHHHDVVGNTTSPLFNNGPLKQSTDHCRRLTIETTTRPSAAIMASMKRPRHAIMAKPSRYASNPTRNSNICNTNTHNDNIHHPNQHSSSDSRGRSNLNSSSTSSRTNKASSSNHNHHNHNTSSSHSKDTFKMKANQPSFPVILMAIMSAHQNKDYITFLSDKKRFIIMNPNDLANKVLPIHFEEHVPTFDQFMYLLNIWGFETIKDPQYPQVNVYQHPQFREGEWETCLDIKLPDPTEKQQQVTSSAQGKETRRGSPGQEPMQGEEPASPRHQQVMGDISLLSPPGTVRSVTPPGVLPLSDAALLERVSSQSGVAAAGSSQPQYSNLGPKFATMEENLLYQRLLHQSMGGQGIQEPAASSTSLMHQHQQIQQTLLERGGSQGRMMHGSSIMPMNHRRATIDMMPSNMLWNMGAGAMSSMSFGAASSTGVGNVPSQQQQQQQQTMLMRQTTPSDDEVRSATQDIVGAALNALRQNETTVQQRQPQQQPRPVHRSRRHTVDALPSYSTTAASTSRLDAMTDMFLERSLARLQTRPAIMGPRPALTQSSVAQHQHQFLGGGGGGIMGRHQQSLVASIDAEVQAQTQAKVFATQLQQRQRGRKVSMLGHMGM